MYKKGILALLILGLILSCTNQEPTTNQYPFMDHILSTDERVQDLIGRLTLEEKLLQLFSGAPAIDRLGVPAYNWWNECLHGVARAGKATVFPQAIGLAATFDTALMSRVAETISDEARAKHNYFSSNDVRSIYTGLTFWSPNINIFRDPRWGRGQETYGEDPYLTGRMAVSFINGLQGNDAKYFKSIATAKHYAVHSGPEFTRHEDNFDVSQRDLYQTYLPAFAMAVKEANVQSVMCAYNRFRDDPCCGSNLLLDEILRNEFGFDGYVVSDCGAISDFYKEGYHEVAESATKAWGWSVGSGTDLNCEVSTAFMEDNVLEAVEVGVIQEEHVDRALARLFKARFQLGLFDPAEEVPWSGLGLKDVGTEKHLQLALEAAEQSLVLLENRNSFLPLNGTPKVALIGPNANNFDILIGNYNGVPINPVTPLKGLRDYLGPENVLYSQGAPLVPGVYGDMAIVPGEVLFHLDNGEKVPGLKASYYTATDFSGSPALERVDSNIDFFWEESPINKEIEEEFSVRWEGVLSPSVSGSYQFGGTVGFEIDGEVIGDRAVQLDKDKDYEVAITMTAEEHWWANSISPSAQFKWINTSEDLENGALQIASKSDVILFCGGISSRLEGEEMPLDIDGFSHGDRTSIELPAVQLELLKKLKSTGKPIIYVNFSGSAVALNWAAENADAVIQAFYPGEATGAALARLIMGDYSPSGKLPVTFYRSVEDLPPFSEYAMENRTYRYYEGTPLYPFGYGMTYSDFEFNVSVSNSSIGNNESVSAVATIKNLGSIKASEIIQVYLADEDASVPVPIQSLVGMTKVVLNPGEEQTVNFQITPEQMQILDESGQWHIEPGTFTVKVCGSTGEKDKSSTVKFRMD